jgi:hypothetical protein
MGADVLHPLRSYAERGHAVSDFFVLSGAVLVGVFATLVAVVQDLREELKTARRANEYLSRRLTAELHARRERVLAAPDREVLAYRAEVDLELREFLDLEPDPNPTLWEKRGNARSYR